MKLDTALLSPLDEMLTLEDVAMELKTLLTSHTRLSDSWSSDEPSLSIINATQSEKLYSFFGISEPPQGFRRSVGFRSRPVSDGFIGYMTKSDDADTKDWFSVFHKQFKKNLRDLDLKLRGRVAEAILDISENPTTVKGDTKKPLTGPSAGKWRYRLGDYRVVYLPVIKATTIFYLTIDSRGSVYDD